MISKEGFAVSIENDSDDEFFCFYHSTAAATNVQQEVDSYLNDNNRTSGTSKKYPAVKHIFLKYNTGKHFSASVERLFSAGWQILTPRRKKLSDDHFEMLLFCEATKT